jgi:hypothetical protein
MTDAGPPWPGLNPALPHTQAPPPPHDAPPPPPPPLTPEQRAERKVQMILDKLDPERLAGITIGEDGVEVCGFNYRTVLDAWEAAKLMALAGSGISPWLRNNPGGCLYIITRAMQLRMDPYSIANWSYEVEQKGGTKRVAWEAGYFAAVVNRRAPIKERIRHEIIGEGDERRCKVWATIVGEDDPRTFISETLAKLRRPNGSPLWMTKPEVQLFYNAVRDFAKIEFGDVVAGLYTIDEMREMG